LGLQPGLKQHEHKYSVAGQEGEEKKQRNGKSQKQKRKEYRKTQASWQAAASGAPIPHGVGSLLPGHQNC
jgi:hypothetical protein